MAKPNYKFAKRQKEIAKQKKKEEKKQRKMENTDSGGGENPEQETDWDEAEEEE